MALLGWIVFAALLWWGYRWLSASSRQDPPAQHEFDPTPAQPSARPEPVSPPRRPLPGLTASARPAVPDALSPQRPGGRPHPPSSPPRATGTRAQTSAATRWVPPGEAVEVRGYVIRDGMVYVGEKLPAVADTGWRTTEPALIDPRLKLGTSSSAIAASSAGYWPSYSEVSPGFRAKYLRWLAEGRTDPAIDLGCVFLFFYGIERRLLLADADGGAVPEAEVRVLLEEVERLLGTYGSNGSFRSYASGFLQLMRARHGGTELDPAVPPAGADGELPLSLRAKLGRFARDRAPIPAEWALAWTRHSPLITLRTAATRCPDEFAAAFEHAYRARFGEGMVLRPNKTQLTLTYLPASASFNRNPVKMVVADLPDVGVLTAPVDRLRQVAETATDAIDRYSRWVGRTGEGESLPALALLPAEVLRPRVRRVTPPLLADVAGAMDGEKRATVPTSMLMRHWPSARADKLSKKEAEGLTELLEKLGVGIAPDVRHTGINPSSAGHAAVFFLPGEAPQPGPDFAAASLLLTLGAAVADADERSQAEEEEMERHLEAAYRLSDADRARLRAHLAWLRVCPPSVAAMKKQLEPLSAEQRAGIARSLIAIAGADGHVSPAEVKMLTKLYPLLGLDPSRLYADVHALASAPVTVIPADPAQDYAIPRPAAAPSRGFTLDISRIESIQRETHDVTRVLASVFADEAPAEAAPVAAVAEPEEESTPATDDRLPGLDAAHSALVRALGERAEISAGEFASLAERCGLMAGGAIETINEAAFQLCDEPLLEGADPIEINSYAREELLK